VSEDQPDPADPSGHPLYPVPSDPSPEPWDAVIVGAGAAGLMAAAEASAGGGRVLLLEKNRKAGVKILMSGGTRCNITQATDNRGIVAAFGPSGRFLHSPLAALGVSDTIELFHAEGVPTKVESTGKVFPVSNKATDVLAALLRRLRRTTATLALDEPVTHIDRLGEGFCIHTPRRLIHANRLLITSGGQSYPGCGTTGDGYGWLAQWGHTIVTPRPALVPITTSVDWVRHLGGITIPDVAVRVLQAHEGKQGGDKLAERRGSLLFAHFGLSGPVVLDVSRAVSGHPDPSSLTLECDFLPTIDSAALLTSFREQAATAGKKEIVTLLAQHLPHRLCEALLSTAGLAPRTKLAELGQRGAAVVVDAVKRQRILVQGTLGFAKAEVTAGGIALAEVDSRTMQSKLVHNLFLAGEILDLDGPIGGYNFQAAWSTGTLAGRSM
jgi:predicted Rossmann fold flavoprotein